MALGASITEVASLAGVHHSTCSRAERGLSVNPELHRKLADAVLQVHARHCEERARLAAKYVAIASALLWANDTAEKAINDLLEGATP